MDGNDKINGATTHSSYYRDFWNGLTKMAGRYKRYLVKPAAPEEVAGVRSSYPVTVRADKRSQRQVCPEPNDTPIKSHYSDQFTQLMTEALWNICEDSESEAVAEPVNEINDPPDSLGVVLPSLTSESEQEMIDFDFEVVEMETVDQELVQSLDHYVSVLSEFNLTRWRGLTEQGQKAFIGDVLKLTAFLDLLSPKGVSESVFRLMGNLDPETFQSALRERIERLQCLGQQLARLLNRKSQILGLLTELGSQLEAEHLRSQMNGLSDVHQSSQSNWETTNRIVSMDTDTLNPDGTAHQFDRDILRNSNFAIFDQHGLSFHSAVCQFEHRQNSSNSKDQNDEHFKEDCRAQLLSLCQGKPEALKGVLTDMVSQSPYNPLVNTLRVMVQEKLGVHRVIAPQERKCETQIHRHEDGRLQLKFVLAFPSYKLTTEEGHCFHIKQPVWITSSMEMKPPEYTIGRKLGDIRIALGKAEESKHYNG